MILPEEVINGYDFGNGNKNITLLKEYLIHHFNTMTLRRYKEMHEFYTKEDIILALPPKIVEFYSIKQPKHKDTKDKFKPNDGKMWIEDNEIVEKLKVFIDHCVKTEECTLKFKDFMMAFSQSINTPLPFYWNAKYEPLFDTLNVKCQKIVDPRYQQGSGTCHINLKI